MSARNKFSRGVEAKFPPPCGVENSWRFDSLERTRRAPKKKDERSEVRNPIFKKGTRSSAEDDTRTKSELRDEWDEVRTAAIESLALGTSISLTSFDRPAHPERANRKRSYPGEKKYERTLGEILSRDHPFLDPGAERKKSWIFWDHFFRDHGKFLNAAGKKIYFLATRTCSRGKTCFDASKNLKKFERGIDSKSIRERVEKCDPIFRFWEGGRGVPPKNRKKRAKSCGAISLVALAE